MVDDASLKYDPCPHHDGLILHMLQQSQGGGKQVMQFGRSRARMQTDVH